jgi:DNA polymerase III delta prime subunit
MIYWHIQMNQPWGRSGGSIDSTQMLNLSQSIIGTGEWNDIQCEYFKGTNSNGIKIGDIILVHEGKKAIALCEVKSNSFKDNNLELKFHHTNFREVAVLKWFTQNETFSQPQGTLERLVNPNTDSWKSIDKWYKNVIISKSMKNYISLLEYKKQIILQGPPGTGKTRLAKLIAKKMINETSEDLSIENIKSLLSVGQKLRSAAGKTEYTVLAISDSAFTIKSDESKEYPITYQSLIDALKSKLWEPGKQKNGSDPYKAAVSKYVYDKLNLSLKSKDNIKLIQFHPAYTYEDFVRGITSKVNGSAQIEYVTENKILAKIAEEALENYLNSQKSQEQISSESWLDIKFKEYLEKLNTKSTNNKYYFNGSKTYLKLIDYDEGKIIYYNDSYYEKGAGFDISFKEIIRHYNNSKNNPLTQNDSSFDYDCMPHFRKLLIPLLIDLRTFIGIEPSNIEKIECVKLKNFVLIIDEINRGNLPAVLGELIYALEYRNESVESVYAKGGDSSIIIPPNLYIIGTMNTSDRSVGHIDYAIRRRFAFVDVLPSTEPIKPFAIPIFKAVSELFISNFDLIDWNNPILERSEFLASDFRPEDIWIGHSYFITNEDGENGKVELELKLKYEIIPILKEYLKDGILLENAKEKIANLHV